jgi:hypothetical protein
MFFITSSMMWSFSYFFLFFYFSTFLFCFIYLFSNNLDVRNFVKYGNKQVKNFLLFKDIFNIFLTFIIFFSLIAFCWNGPTITSWFGHFVFAAFQNKILYFVLFYFLLFLSFVNFSVYLNNRAIYDFLLINFNFLYWMVFIFYANTIFSVIFFIEILSTLIFLLFITSNFSSNFFYNNLNLNLSAYFNQQAPFFLVNSLIFFFWISLLASLSLFIFLLIFYFKFLIFDWFLNEFFLYYFFQSRSFLEVYIIFFIWFFFVFAVFLKCGLSPFYFWKPFVFKSLPLQALTFYITFFYFFIFLYFILLLINYFNEIFYFYLFTNLLTLLLGFVLLLSVLTEAYYFKAFLAMSSILNTLFVFLIFNSLNTSLLFI